MIDPLTYIAGFICEEGQLIANLKQVSFTLLVAAIFWFLADRVKRSGKYNLLSIIILIIGTFITLLTFVVGPILYSSWGCDSLLDPLFAIYS